MTVKLKKLREQPLLTPPAEAGRVIPEEDERTVLSALEDARRGDGWTTALLLHGMASLGMNPKVLEKDVENMALRLDEYRTVQDGWGIGAMLYFMSELGLPADAGEDDLTRIREGLLGDDGILVAGSHLFLKRLGHPQEITGDEEKRIVGWYEKSAREKEGVSLARMLAFAGELEIKLPKIPDLEDTLLNDLDEARKQKHAWEILVLQGALKRIRKPQKKEGSTPPPLRRFD